MVIVLTGTAILTGAVLALVNRVTEKEIANQVEKEKREAVYAALGTTDDIITIAEPENIKQIVDGKKLDFEVYRATDKDGKDYGVAVKSTTQGFGGDLSVMVGFDTEGNVISYRVLKHFETPGLGAKAGEWFQKGQKGDITGKKAGNLTVSKDGGNVDAITASTITSRAFLRAVNQAYNAYMAKEKDVITGASDVHTGASAQKQNK
ncbi:MAG: RnfABCDGE type electron transport complex subunit G [Prevotella sp.]|nr:RnfABCDGE type electron transport complex subunit G [Candidatus Equicola faecalis]